MKVLGSMALKRGIFGPRGTHAATALCLSARHARATGKAV